jgi:peptidoglycan hydrolase CwlO-like protein
MNNKLLIITTIIVVLVSFFALPIDTSAKTIQEFEAEVEKYTKDLQDRKAKIATNEEEIRKIKNRIAEIERTIAATEEEIKVLQQEIEECEKEIAQKSEESKNIISYYQISNGENAYLEYAFGAEDITDMIYRLSIVEQLTEYNDKIMKELEALIQRNE